MEKKKYKNNNVYIYAHVRCIVFILALDLSAQIFHIFIVLWHVQPAALEP